MIERQLAEKSPSGHADRLRLELIEIIEAVILALVAVGTAWSGYQAARWDGNRARLYAEANRLRVNAEGLATLAGQERIYDTTTFNSWLLAKLDGKKKGAEFFARRFRDEYRRAFTAWLKTNPFDNPNAPPGPIFMPEYQNSKGAQAVQLNQQASAAFDRGTESGENGDQYVRITVILATILLVTAIGQRFRVKLIRTAFTLVACLLLGLQLARLLALPHL